MALVVGAVLVTPACDVMTYDLLGNYELPDDGNVIGGVDREWAQWPVNDLDTFEIRDPSVYQPATGLEWLSDARLNWEDAKQHCRSLGEGWRLPTRIELVSLVDHAISSPASSFPGATGDTYWSATPVANGEGSAWVVDFEFGDTRLEGIASSHRVRCVSAQPVENPGPSFQVKSDGTVLDAKTGLVWQRAVDGVNRSREEAESYCATLELPGDGWRLPTVMELLTLVDVRRSNPSIDGAVFPGTRIEEYWAVPRSAAPGAGWGVNFHLGSAERQSVANASYQVRCVR